MKYLLSSIIYRHSHNHHDIKIEKYFSCLSRFYGKINFILLNQIKVHIEQEKFRLFLQFRNLIQDIYIRRETVKKIFEI